MAGGLNVIPGDGSVVAIQNPNDANEYWAIPGVSAWTEGGGDTPQRDVVAFEGVSSQQGRTRAQTVECEVSAYSPLHRAWVEAKKAQDESSKRNFVLFTERQEYWPFGVDAAVQHIAIPQPGAGETSAIATIAGTGVGSGKALDLTSSNFAPGMTFAVGTDAASVVRPTAQNVYVIERITGATTAVVSRADKAVNFAAVAANSKFAIIEPQLERGPASCSVGGADRSSTRAEGDLSAGMTLTPGGVLPAYRVSTVDLGEVKSK